MSPQNGEGRRLLDEETLLVPAAASLYRTTTLLLPGLRSSLLVTLTADYRVAATQGWQARFHHAVQRAVKLSAGSDSSRAHLTTITWGSTLHASGQTFLLSADVLVYVQ